MSDRAAAAEMADRHHFPVREMATQGRVDRALIERHMPFHDRQIATRHGARLELFRQDGMRLGRFRHHQQSRRILVQPMHDACPRQRLLEAGGWRLEAGGSCLEPRALSLEQFLEPSA